MESTFVAGTSAEVFWLVRMLASGLLAVIVFFVYRAIASHSATLGSLVAAGILLRSALGLALFWISYLDLALLRDLHMGNGFWHLAPDALSYFQSASHAAEYGLGTIQSGSASPAFVQALALWMMVVGISPASAILFNLACYLLACAALLAVYRDIPDEWRHTASLYTVAALTFSPALIVFGTQPLKDTFFALLAVLMAIGAYYVASSVSAISGARRMPRLLVGWAAMLPAIYLIAGIRAYFAVLVWGCLVIAFGAAAARWRLSGARRLVAIASTTLVAVWLVFMTGAGAYYASYDPMILVEGVKPRPVFSALARARDGFIRSGGATNIVALHEETGTAAKAGQAPRQPTAPPAPIARDVETGSSQELESRRLGEHARALAVGLGTVFVPISALRTLSIIEFQGGRGLLVLTDLDTLFLDLTIACGFIFLVRGWPLMRAHVPYVVFLLSLTVLLTGAMAYVITNYGTLIRLRLMVAVLVWTLPLAMRASARGEGPGAWRAGGVIGPPA